MARKNLIMILVAAAAVAGIAGYLIYNAAKKADGPVVAQSVLDATPSLAKGLEWCPSKGPEAAKVTMVEFTDFQ